RLASLARPETKERFRVRIAPGTSESKRSGDSAKARTTPLDSLDESHQASTRHGEPPFERSSAEDHNGDALIIKTLVGEALGKLYLSSQPTLVPVPSPRKLIRLTS